LVESWASRLARTFWVEVRSERSWAIVEGEDISGDEAGALPLGVPGRAVLFEALEWARGSSVGAAAGVGLDRAAAVRSASLVSAVC